MKRLIRKVAAAKKLQQPATPCPTGCGSLLYEDDTCSDPKCSNFLANIKDEQKRQKAEEKAKAAEEKAKQDEEKRLQNEQKQQRLSECPDIAQLDDNDDQFNYVEFHYKIKKGYDGAGKFYRDYYGVSGIFTRNKTKFLKKYITQYPDSSWIQYVFKNQIFDKLTNGEIPADNNRVGAEDFVTRYRAGEIYEIPEVKRGYKQDKDVAFE